MRCELMYDFQPMQWVVIVAIAVKQCFVISLKYQVPPCRELGIPPYESVCVLSNAREPIVCSSCSHGHDMSTRP